MSSQRHWDSWNAIVFFKSGNTIFMLFIHWIHFYKKWLHNSPHFYILPLTYAIFPPPFGFNTVLSSQIDGIFAFSIAITHVQRDGMKKSFLKLYVYNNKNGSIRLYLYTFASFNLYSFLCLNLCRVINIIAQLVIWRLKELTDVLEKWKNICCVWVSIV